MWYFCPHFSMDIRDLDMRHYLLLTSSGLKNGNEGVSP